MKPLQVYEKTDAHNKKDAQWGHLLKAADDMYLQDQHKQAFGNNLRKEIYKVIMEEHMKSVEKEQQNKSMMERQADEDMHNHWKREAQRRDREQAQRKLKLKQAALFNRDFTNSLIQKRTEQPPYTLDKPSPNPHSQGSKTVDMGQVYSHEMTKRKQLQAQMQRAYQMQNQIIQQRRQSQMSHQIAEEQRRQREAQDFQRRRQAQFKRIRDAHQQNMRVFGEFQHVNRKRQQQEELLLRSIVEEGARQKNQKNIEDYRRQIQEYQHKKQEHVHGLKAQLESDRHRALSTDFMEKAQDRYVSDKSMQLYHYIKNRQAQEHKKNQIELAKTLLQQQDQKHKRELYQNSMSQKEAAIHRKQIEKQKPLYQHNSPFHVGQVPYLDRRSQLSQIDQQLLKNLSLLSNQGTTNQPSSPRQSVGSNSPQKMFKNVGSSILRNN